MAKFEKDDDKLVLPASVSLETLKQLTAKLKFLQSSIEASTKCEVSADKDSKICATTLPLDKEAPVKKLDKLTIQPRIPSARTNVSLIETKSIQIDNQCLV